MASRSESNAHSDNVHVAFEDANHRLIARARAASTEVAIWRDGKIVQLSTFRITDNGRIAMTRLG